MVKEGAFTIHVQEIDVDKRLDVVVPIHLPECPRSLASALVKKGAVKVQNTQKKPGYKVRSGETITGLIPKPEEIDVFPEPTPFRILHEDEHLIVIDKPPGLVVHPSPGHAHATLVHGLLFHCPDLQGIGGRLRPGIVHRLDKDTSGIILIAKNSRAQERLSAQFKKRTIKKEYLALVWGMASTSEGRIVFPIGRHPRDRKKMSIRSYSGRYAETLWKVLEEYENASLFHLLLKTGRTHQIRVHCSAINHPILGDTTYAKKRKNLLKTQNGSLKIIPRQMLHAWRITFNHPFDEAEMVFQSEPPADMMEIINILRLSREI